MRSASLYYLAQTWTADRYQQAQRDPPARAASRAGPPRPSPRAPRIHGLPAVVAHRLRIVLGGGSP
jgi:hypothetical protein